MGKTLFSIKKFVSRGVKALTLIAQTLMLLAAFRNLPQTVDIVNNIIIRSMKSFFVLSVGLALMVGGVMAEKSYQITC
jgi:Na+/H+ antiporter NhaD/arsenite permease-like protein